MVDWELVESLTGVSFCRLSVHEDEEGKSHWLRSGLHTRPGAQLCVISIPLTHT